MKPLKNVAVLVLALAALSVSAPAAGTRKQRRLARNQARLRKIFDAMPDAKLRAINPDFAQCSETYAARQVSFAAAVKNLSRRKFNGRRFRRMFKGWDNYCRCMIENAHNLSNKTESVCWKRRFRKRPTKRLLKSAWLGWERVSKRHRKKKHLKHKHFFRKRLSDRIISFNLSHPDNTVVHASIVDIPGYFPDNIDFFDAATCSESRRREFFERVSCEALGARAFFSVQLDALRIGIANLVDTEPSVPVPQISREQMSCAFGPELDDVRMTFNARDPISVIVDALVELVNPDQEPSSPNTTDASDADATAFGNKIRFKESMEDLLSRENGRTLIRHELYHVLQWKNQAGNANLQTAFGRTLATSLMGYAFTREYCLADFKYPCGAAECDAYYCQSIDLCSSPEAGSQVLNQACATSDYAAPPLNPLDF